VPNLRDVIVPVLDGDVSQLAYGEVQRRRASSDTRLECRDR